jgi:hypothetical protein
MLTRAWRQQPQGSRATTRPLCGYDIHEKVKLDTAWGTTAHRMWVITCERCQSAMTSLRRPHVLGTSIDLSSAA